MQNHFSPIAETAIPMDAVTRAVKEMYESHPYPYTAIKPEPLKDLYILLHMLFAEGGIDDSDIAAYSFFDGGCGSGQRILGVASELPTAHFTAVDMTEASLEVAREQAAYLGVTNITFKQDNLLELADTGTYDVVTSVGVIHHLSDPARGVRNLSGRVAESGVLILHLYHTLGEHRRMLQRELTRALTHNEDLDFGIRMMKDLGFSLPLEQYGSNGYNNNLTEADHLAKDIDVYLHPVVATYRFAEMAALFRSSGLDWLAINSVNTGGRSWFVSASCPVEPLAFDPASCLPTQQLMAAYGDLSAEDRLRIIELLLEPTSFSLVAGRNQALEKIGPRLHCNLLRLNA